MIIEYDSKYDEDIKDLLLELQKHIVSIDKEGYNIITDSYREEYFKKTMNEVSKYEGKILLYEEENKVQGLIVSLIENDEMEEYSFKAPKRGRISELVVSKNVRNKGIGSKLLNCMTDYLKSVGCKSILIGVFAYNDNAVKFYQKNGYHLRMHDMISVIDKK